MKEPEFHLFCIWNKGLPYAESILNEIKKRFIILDVADVSWQGQGKAGSLFRFYVNPKWIIFWKYLRCGGDPVRMIVVRDDHPEYQERHTNSGVQKVNVGLFDMKIRLRAMLKNGHLIHATNSPFEFAFNYAMLTGKPANIDTIRQMPEWDEQITARHIDLPGKKPWKDLRSLFDIISPMGNFLVLRNYEGLPESCRFGPHSDIDILTSAPGEMIRLLNLKKASLLPTRAVWRAAVADSWVNIDIRTPHDGYYPEKMVKLMLENAVLHNNIPVPAPEHYFYSLVYHAAIHKYKMSDEYVQRLLAMAEKNGKVLPAGENPRQFLTGLLCSWMEQHGFEFTEPTDLTVNFNAFYYKGTPRVSWLRKVKNALFHLLGKKIHCE